MPLLEMRDASFTRDATTIVHPLSLHLERGERLALPFSSTREAAAAALLASGIVKATHGRVFISEFDPRIQPVQAKRLVGYVPYDAVAHEFATFEDYITYRSALWAMDAGAAVGLARALLARLDGVHEAFARPLIGALVGHPALLVLDRPLALYAPQIARVTSGLAIFSTHESTVQARTFEDGYARAVAPA